MTRSVFSRMNVKYNFIPRTRNRDREHSGQEFLRGFGKGLAAIDSHENGRDISEFVALQLAVQKVTTTVSAIAHSCEF